MAFLKSLLKVAKMLNKTTKARTPKVDTKPIKTGKLRILRTDDFPTAAVGESHYQKALQALCPERSTEDVALEVTATLVCEVDNPHDEDAVLVKIGARKVGYLSSDDAVEYREALEDQFDGTPSMKVAAIIRGGGIGTDGNRKSYGVWLAMEVPPVLG